MILSEKCQELTFKGIRRYIEGLIRESQSQFEQYCDKFLEVVDNRRMISGV